MKLVDVGRVAAEAVNHDLELKKRVLFGVGELPAGVRFSHAELLPGQRVSAHSHESICELFYILSGRGSFIINGEAVTVREGCSIRIDAGEVHELVNDSNGALTMIYFGLKV